MLSIMLLVTRYCNPYFEMNVLHIVTCLVTVYGVWIGNWSYWTLIQLMTTGNYGDITNSHTLQFTTAHIKSSMSSVGVAW
jgi:hypothetical protein